MLHHEHGQASQRDADPEQKRDQVDRKNSAGLRKPPIMHTASRTPPASVKGVRNQLEVQRIVGHLTHWD